MEKILEIVTITMANGKTQVFEVTADSSRYPGLRAYGRGMDQYYNMSALEKGLCDARIVKKERKMTADVFDYDDLLQASK